MKSPLGSQRPFTGKFPGSKIVHVNDTASCVRTQLVDSIQQRDEFVNMTVKKVNDELYDQRYAFMTYAQGKKSAIGDYSEPLAQRSVEATTSRTHLQGLSQHLHGSIHPEDLREGQGKAKSRLRLMGPSSAAASVKARPSNTRPSGGASAALQTRNGLNEEDPGTLRLNQSQSKFWYKVRVKSSHGPRPKVLESFRR